jgi:hypothetical protein
MKIKAISLKQPWATMVAEGIKIIETRVWSTKYRGPLLIVSSLNFDFDADGLPSGGNRPESTDYYGTELNLLYGQALAVCDLLDCRPMHMIDRAGACCDVYPRAQAWIIEGITPIDPFPVKGKLGIYEVELPEHFYHNLVLSETNNV